jgi:EAL domain-containing protein (putative c-di-GMP-specific phosphodiesterase class I)/GGDEF domain-containing protein
MYLYGVLALLATYALLRLTARALGWPRERARRRVELADVPRFALIGTIALPLALVVLTAVLEATLRTTTPFDVRTWANAMVQVFFAKHFGVLILTLPLVVYVTHGLHAAPARAWWLAAVPWRLLLVGVVLPVGLLQLASGEHSAFGDSLTGIVDYRLIVAAVLIGLAIRTSVRWSMPLLVMAQLLFTAGLTRYVSATTGLPDLIDLLLVAFEILILESLVLLLFLYDRDRGDALAQHERDGRCEPLTRLPNLAALRKRLAATRSGREIGYLLLDRTDKVSAGLGLKAEVALVRAVAARLRDAADAYYIGSGQLVLVTAASRAGETTPWSAVLECMHAFELVWARRRVRVLPYLGVASTGAEAEPVDDLILRASNAAFEARQRGETRVLHADLDVEPGRPEHRRSALDLSSVVLSRLRANEIELYFQPIVALKRDGASAALSGEILCRIRDADGALMAPSTFIPEIAADRRMVELDLAVLRSLAEWLRRHHGELPPLGQIGINLAGQSLASSGFSSALFDVLRDFPLPLSSLCFEVTESAAITHLREAGELFGRLRESGCQIAIDDFGIGFQSFERLKQIPVGMIKIDGTFVREMTRSERDRELVRAAVAVARAFDAETVAEYVEDAATAAAVHELHVDFGQGFYFGHPAPLHEVLLGRTTA